MMSRFKLTVFDMDGTLLTDRTIFVFAEKKGFKDELMRVINNEKMEFYEKSIEIAKALKGTRKDELLEIFRGIPLHENVEFVISELRRRGVKTAIVTDSYQFVADDLKERLGMDFAFANNLIIDDGIVTGDLLIYNTELKRDLDNGKIYSICKKCVMDQLCKELGIPLHQVIAVGDGKIDISMIKEAGLGVAFNAPVEVQKYADVVTSDLSVILRYIG
ncbi:MAG: hypothetical protein DRM99_02075 [Thermoplasmata archaeon]|nr:MAG: hypothetical protein DRM99_02075 [Thermoplasmata archaeon]RLF51851.1 MAG: hypothetical protein DRN24_04230 [Thermoplasmata archaeon]